MPLSGPGDSDEQSPRDDSAGSRSDDAGEYVAVRMPVRGSRIPRSKHTMRRRAGSSGR